jgi:tetratricopeptide (TPR) repeat protein
VKYSLNLKRLWDAASGRNGLILGGAAAATVLIVFGFLTLRELRRWQGREPPDMQVLAGKSAFAVGYDIYIQGNESNQRGELEEAARRYRESLKINPGFVPAHNNLGVALAKAGKFDDAMASLRRGALQSRPGAFDTR